MSKEKNVIKIVSNGQAKIDLGRTTPKPSNLLKPNQPKTKK